MDSNGLYTVPSHPPSRTVSPLRCHISLLYVFTFATQSFSTVPFLFEYGMSAMARGVSQSGAMLSTLHCEHLEVRNLQLRAWMRIIDNVRGCRVDRPPYCLCCWGAQWLVLQASSVTADLCVTLGRLVLQRDSSLGDHTGWLCGTGECQECKVHLLNLVPILEDSPQLCTSIVSLTLCRL